MSPSDWQLKSHNGLDYFEYSPDPKLVLSFFTRRGGVSAGAYESLNTSFQVGDKEEHVEENLERCRRVLGLTAILTFMQTHSDTVLPITARDMLAKTGKWGLYRASSAGDTSATRSSRRFVDVSPRWDCPHFPSSTYDALEGDACITDHAGLGLGLRVADCLPVYIYAADASCAGVAHCGWRGTASRLAEKTACQMSRNYSVPLADMRFALGPCICPNCYQVGDDVRHEFAKTFPNPDQFFSPVAEKPAARQSPLATRHSLRFSLDLRAANRSLLTDIGLTEAPSLSLCTCENKELFYSARRDCRGKPGTVPRNACVELSAVQSPFSATGRNLAVIAIR